MLTLVEKILLLISVDGDLGGVYWDLRETLAANQFCRERSVGSRWCAGINKSERCWIATRPINKRPINHDQYHHDHEARHGLVDGRTADLGGKVWEQYLHQSRDGGKSPTHHHVVQFCHTTLGAPVFVAGVHLLFSDWNDPTDA